jgi:hypothetical protein
MKLLFTIIFISFIQVSFSQKFIDLAYISVLGKEKNFQFYVNHDFSYRLKGKLLYHTHKLTNMQDSFLVFDSDQIIKLGQIRSVKVKSAKIDGWLYKAGFAFLALDVTNNLVQSRTPVLNERTLLVTSAFVVAGAIVSYFQEKRIRITKNCTFRIIDIDTQNLNASK